MWWVIRRRNLKEAKRELENCRKQAITPEKVAEEVRLWCLVDHLEEDIDIKWRQRGHVWWLKEGDRNTKFFFRYASARRKANRIRRLRREDGVVVEEGRDLTNYVISYFQDLFTSNGNGQYDELLWAVPVKVTSAMNESFTVAFSDMEMKAALDQIGDLKALGPDAMPAVVFKKYCHLMGRNIIEEVRHVLEEGEMPAGWNDTHVVLIPKVKKP